MEKKTQMALVDLPVDTLCYIMKLLGHKWIGNMCVCHILQSVATDESLWRGWCAENHWTRKDPQLTWRQYFVERKSVGKKMKILWEMIYPRMHSTCSPLNPPATEQAIIEAETKMGILFPLEVREYLRVHNGQTLEHHEFGMGLINGNRLVSLEEMIKDFQLYKDTRRLAMTEKFGFSQLFVDFQTGAVFSNNGFNTFQKAANWLEFLAKELLDS